MKINDAYICMNCDEIFERFRRNGELKHQCPSCASTAIFPINNFFNSRRFALERLLEQHPHILDSPLEELDQKMLTFLAERYDEGIDRKRMCELLIRSLCFHVIFKFEDPETVIKAIAETLMQFKEKTGG